MLIPILIGAAAVLFVAGIVFIVKGVSSEDQKVVPISNPKEIEELKSAFMPPQKKELSEAELEIQKKIEPQITPRLEEAQVNPLTEENVQLKAQMEDQKNKVVQLEKTLEDLRKEYNQLKGQEKEDASSGHELLDELKTKKESLEKQYEESRNQQVELEAAINQLKTEKDDLSVQVKRREDQAAELQTELTSVKAASEGKLKAAQETINQFETQRPEVDKSELDALSNKLVEAIASIEGLKCENRNLQQLTLDLKANFKTTKELNAHLLEKEQMMQYELTKNRAQALGLEKICEDFRTRIETMAATAAAES